MSASAEGAQRLAGGRVLHERCYDAYLGFGQAGSSNGPGAEPVG